MSGVLVCIPHLPRSCLPFSLVDGLSPVISARAAWYNPCYCSAIFLFFLSTQFSPMAVSFSSGCFNQKRRVNLSISESGVYTGWQPGLCKRDGWVTSSSWLPASWVLLWAGWGLGSSKGLSFTLYSNSVSIKVITNHPKIYWLHTATLPAHGSGR